MAYSIEQRAKCAAWFECMESVTLVQRKFRSIYGKNIETPSSSTIKKWHTSLMERGSVIDQARIRPKTATSPEKCEEVKHHFEIEPNTSVRSASSKFDISRESIRRCLKHQGFHPYKMQIVQSLSEEDETCRLNFASEELERISSSNHFEHLTFSDEAHFILDGSVNRHNCRYWSTENPHWYQEKPLHSRRTTVWAAISRTKVYGPFFFDETITSERYLDMLKNQFLPTLSNHEKRNMIFMHDGAPPHWGVKVRDWLDQRFPHRWMGRGSPTMPWPPRSPDMTPCDFFLWGFLKSQVYGRPIRDVTDLKKRIVDSFKLVTPQMMSNAFDEYRHRLNVVIEQGGGHCEC